MGGEQAATANFWTPKRIVQMFLIVLAGSAIYELPYLRYLYYDALIAATGLSNTDFGNTMTVFGIVAFLGYYPGGLVGDRFSSRKLLTVALLGTGACGVWFSFYPDYFQQLIIYALWGVFSGVLFWAAAAKATRKLGSSAEQGRLFGLVEGGKGLLPALYGFFFLWIFNTLGANVFGLTWTIRAYAALSIVAGIAIWFLLDDDGANEARSSSSVVADALKVAKISKVWLAGIIVFCSYVSYTALSYVTPYLTEIFAAGVSVAAAISLVRTYVIAAGAGPLGGVVADRIGSSIKVCVGGFVIIAIALCCYLALPGDPGLIAIALVLMVVLAAGVFVTRGVYFAVIDEIGIPLNLTGAAVGLVSLIGFLPETFIYTLFGSVMDSNPGIGGYRIMFAFMLVFSIVGILAASILWRKTHKSKANAAHEAGEQADEPIGA